MLLARLRSDSIVFFFLFLSCLSSPSVFGSNGLRKFAALRLSPTYLYPITMNSTFRTKSRSPRKHCKKDLNYELMVHLLGSINGKRYSLPGVGSEDDVWAIPCTRFQIQDIIHKYLIQLETTSTKDRFKIKYDEQSKALLSEGPVNALVDTNGQIRIYGGLAAIADANNMVRVSFGTEKLCEDFEDKECADIRTLNTPDTPSSPSDSI